MGVRLYMNNLENNSMEWIYQPKNKEKNTSKFARLCNYLSIALFIVLDLYIGEGKAKTQIERWWKDFVNNFFLYIREWINIKQLVVYRNMERIFAKPCNFC